MRDKYNLNTLPASAHETEETGETGESNAIPMIPGMAPEDRVEPMNFPPPMIDTDFSRVPPPTHVTQRGNFRGAEQEGIQQQQQHQQQKQQQEQEEARRKMPFSKPIPKSFQNRYEYILYYKIRVIYQAIFHGLLLKISKKKMFYSWNDLSSGAPPPPQPGSQAQEFIPPNCLSLQVCYILCIYFIFF